MTDTITEGKEMALYRKDILRLQEKERQIQKYLINIGNSEVSRFDIGKLLGEIRREQLFIHYFKTFDEYVQTRFKFRKSHASHMESVWNIRNELEIELEKIPGAFNLPRSVEAAYRLKKAGSLEKQVALLVRLKSEGREPTTEAIMSCFTKSEDSSQKKKRFPEFKRLLNKVKTACLDNFDYGEDRSLLLEEIRTALQELSVFQEKLLGRPAEAVVPIQPVEAELPPEQPDNGDDLLAGSTTKEKYRPNNPSRRE